MGVWKIEPNLSSRDWAMGTGVQPPRHNNWLHDLGTAIILIFPCLTMIVVSLRLWGRWRLRKLGIDDFIIIIATVFSFAAAGFLFMSLKTRYLGIPRQDIPPHNEARGLLFAHVADVVHPLSVSLAKSSILFFLLGRRIPQGVFRKLCHAVNVVILLAMATILFTTIFQCLPIEMTWDDSIGGGGKCLNKSLLKVSRTCWAMVADVAILGLSAWSFLRSRMTRSTQGGILLAFILGTLALGTSIAQLYFLLQDDFSKDAAQAPGRATSVIWITMPIEATLIIIAASIPTLGALFRQRFPPPLPHPDEPISHSDSNPDLSETIAIHHTPKGACPSDSSLVIKPLHGFGYTDTEIRPGSRRVISTGGIMRTLDVDVVFGERRAQDGIRATTWGWT